MVDQILAKVCKDSSSVGSPRGKVKVKKIVDAAGSAACSLAPVPFFSRSGQSGQLPAFAALAIEELVALVAIGESFHFRIPM